MDTRCYLRAFTACLLFFGICAGESAAQEELAEALQKAKTFVTVRKDDKELESVPVLTTSNPTRGAAVEGTMLLWLHHGRPMAAMSIYAWEGRVMHECDSLSRAGDFLATALSGKRWTPKQPGVSFQPLATETGGELSDVQRLQKMRTFAKQFEVTMLGFNDQNSDREQLRMLTTPLYRYQLKDARNIHRNLVDGAIFAFVQGTDPELLLVLELNRNDKQLEWEYAMVRATAGALEAKRNRRVVFEASKFPENTNQVLPHFTFSHEVAEIDK